MELIGMDRREMGALLPELAEWLYASLRDLGASPADAKEISSEAILRLFENWASIEAEHGVYSLKAWLQTTGRRELWRRNVKERRALTNSLQEDIPPCNQDGSSRTLEETIADDNCLDFWDLPMVREEDVRAAKAALSEITRDCILEKRSSKTRCEKRCELLWIKYASREKVTLAELARWVGKPVGTVYDWLDDCQERFKRAFQIQTGETNE